MNQLSLFDAGLTERQAKPPRMSHPRKPDDSATQEYLIDVDPEIDPLEVALVVATMRQSRYDRETDRDRPDEPWFDVIEGPHAVQAYREEWRAIKSKPRQPVPANYPTCQGGPSCTC